MRTGNIMIGAVKKATVTEIVRSNINRYSLKDDPYDVALDIGKKYNWSVKKIEQAERVIRKSYINGIGAVKSGKIRFDGKRVFYQDEKGDDLIAYISSYMTLTSNPGLSDAVTKKINSWAKRKGFKIKKD